MASQGSSVLMGGNRLLVGGGNRVTVEVNESLVSELELLYVLVLERVLEPVLAVIRAE